MSFLSASKNTSTWRALDDFPQLPHALDAGRVPLRHFTCLLLNVSPQPFSRSPRTLREHRRELLEVNAGQIDAPAGLSPSMIGAVIATPSIFSSRSASIFADTADMSTGPRFPRSASARTSSVSRGLRFGAGPAAGA